MYELGGWRGEGRFLVGVDLKKGLRRYAEGVSGMIRRVGRHWFELFETPYAFSGRSWDGIHWGTTRASTAFTFENHAAQ